MKEETLESKKEIRKLRAIKDVDYEQSVNKIKKEKIDIQKKVEEYKSKAESLAKVNKVQGKALMDAGAGGENHEITNLKS